MQNALDEIQSEEEVRSSSRVNGWDNEDDFEEDEDDADSSEDLLGTPEEGASTADEATPEDDVSRQAHARGPPTAKTTTTTTTSSTIPPPTSTIEAGSAPTTTTTPGPALRNRHRNDTTTPSTTATATGSSLHKPTPTSPPPEAETEEALSTDRLEQENLTSSLLDLATQLKSSSHAFQASLEAEKSVLARAAEGLDRTTGNLASAERRMGMLRRMTEGKGWWGRMLLYAWIFALWVVAVLIVFVGPKLRF